MDLEPHWRGASACGCTVAGSATLATLVGERTHLVWPAEYDLRRIVVHDPTPVYPHSLVRALAS